MHGFGLADHALAEAALHLQELVLFAFQHLVDGNAGPARDHLRDVVGGDRLLHHLAGILLGLDVSQPLLQLGDPAIGQLARLLVLAAALRIGELDAERVQLTLELLRVRQLVLLGAPFRGQRGRLLLEIGELLLQRLQPGLGAEIALLLQGLLLDLESDDLAVQRVQLLGLAIDLHLQPRRRLVHQVDGLVGEEAVGDVAV